MDETTYLNFDLLIEQTADAYRARVLNSPAGQASLTFIPPFFSSDLEEVLTSDNLFSFDTKFFGEQLYQSIFVDDIRNCLLRSQ